MGYKLNYLVSLIDSPIALIFPDGNKKNYSFGKEINKESFDKRFDIKSIKANEGMVEIVLVENDGKPRPIKDSSWSGLSDNPFD